MKRIAIAALAVLVVAGAVCVGYGIHQKRALRAQLVQLVDAAGVRLAEALAADPGAPSPAVADRLSRLSEEVDADLASLRTTDARPDPALAEAADAFVSGAAAVLKRAAGSVRWRLRFTDSRRALAEHVAKAGQRSEGWSAEAIRLKERLDADYFEYRIAATSLGNMLGELPRARAKAAALMPSARLPEEGTVREARSRALAAAEATRLEFEQAKQLIPR